MSETLRICFEPTNEGQARAVIEGLSYHNEAKTLGHTQFFMKKALQP